MKTRASLAAFLLMSVANAAELKQQTIQAWDEHVALTNREMQKRIHRGAAFLWISESPARMEQVRRGEIVVTSALPQNPEQVPSGLIHHWIGVVFLPGTKLDNVFSVVRNYGRYKNYYSPVVVDSKPVRQSRSEDQFRMLLMNRSLLTKTAIDGEYRSNYVQVDPCRWYSVSDATRVQEIADYGQPGERTLQGDQASGYIWRVHSVTRFEERDGGVYIEADAMVLSRDIPASLRWLVTPMVRRIGRGSMLTSLRQTHDAVALISTTSSGSD